MSKDKKPAAPQGGASTAEYCPTEGCKKPAERMHFCQEHFGWYKEGLINKKGLRPTDFDKKYQNYMRKKAA